MNSLRGLVVVVSFLLLVACAAKPDIETIAAWRLKADKAYQDGQYQDALGYYQKLTKATPAEADVWFRLGNTQARLGKSEDAVKAYREAVLRDQHFARAWYNAGLNQLRASADTFSESLRYISKEDPVYQVSEQYYQKLLLLMEQQNQALAAMSQKPDTRPLDVQAVEMIVLDGKSGGLSEELPEGLTHEELLQMHTEPEPVYETDPVDAQPAKTLGNAKKSPVESPAAPSADNAEPADPDWFPPMVLDPAQQKPAVTPAAP